MEHKQIQIVLLDFGRKKSVRHVLRKVFAVFTVICSPINFVLIW